MGKLTEIELAEALALEFRRRGRDVERDLMRAEQAQGVRGRVAEVLFKGTYRSYLVDVEGGTRLSVARRHRARDVQPYDVGDDVVVSWSYHDACVLRD